MEEIENRIQYRFKNREFLYTALTHRSYNEGRKENQNHNERLEFLGDSVIGLAITDYLFRKLRNREEGELAKLKAHLVSSDSLFQIAQQVDLGSAIFLGRGEEKNKGRLNKKILSSAFEALIGAVYLDAGFRTASQMVVQFFEKYIEPLLQNEMRINDYKSELQELLQKHRNILPLYRVVDEKGRPPVTFFKVAVLLDGVEIGCGTGKSRKEAEQQAAYQALQNIGNYIHIEKLSEVFFAKETPPADSKLRKGIPPAGKKLIH